MTSIYRFAEPDGIPVVDHWCASCFRPFRVSPDEPVRDTYALCLDCWLARLRPSSEVGHGS